MTIVAIILVVNIANGQNELCFTSLDNKYNAFYIRFGGCNGADMPMHFQYSRDAVEWNSFKTAGYYRQGNTWVVTTNSIEGLNVGDNLYLRSSKYTYTTSPKSGIGGSVEEMPIGKIFVSGSFNSLNNDIDNRKVNMSDWRAIFDDGLKNNVMGIDISMYDPSTQMFSKWKNLNYIKVNFTSWGTHGFDYWVEGVASTGIFVCPRELEIKYGTSYIPNNWRVVYIDELKNIQVSEQTRDYVKIARTKDIAPDTEISFSVTDRTTEGYKLSEVAVIDENDNEINTIQNGNDYSFTMPDKNVRVNVTYTPIEYNITCSEYVSADLSQATVHDIVNISVADRTLDGYKLDKVLVNGGVFTRTYIVMKNYLKDIQIQAVYSKMDYSIKVDDYIYTTQTKAQVGDKVYLIFKPNKTGYKFVSANYNGIDLTITNNRAEFTMPAANVVVETVFEPIQYNVIAGEFIDVDKTSASIEDEVKFSAVDRTAEGYKFEKILINNVAYQKDKKYVNQGAFSMKNYLKDVEIKAEYSKISYSITTDEYSTASVRTATVGEEIELTFKGKQGYYPAIADCNGKELIITDNKASFMMPTENVTIKTTFSPIQYNVIAGDYVTADKTTATIEDVVSFSAANRESEGYKLDKVLVNGKVFSGKTFEMKYYLQDVNIEVFYSKIDYTITTDDFSKANQKTANVGDKIIVQFNERDGYSFVSANCNGKALSVSNKQAEFIMPTNNVEIKTTYTAIQYNIVVGDYLTIDKTMATIEDKIRVTAQDRTSEGYKLVKVLVNNNVVAGVGYTPLLLSMKNYLQDIKIEAVYSKIDYTINTDNFSSVNKTIANVGDIITVQFADKNGYKFVSATYNGNTLTVLNGKAEFIMPTNNVEIETTWTPIQYKVIAGDYITVDNTKATIEDIVYFTVKDRTSEGYKLDKVFVNNTVVSGTSFAMKNYMKDVTINATYVPIQYNVVAGDFVSVDKSTATMNDQVGFSVKDRTAEGYKFDKVLINNTAVSGTSFAMKDFMKDVTISAIYTPIQYNIIVGDFITADKTTATAEDKVVFTAQDRTSEGYKLDKVLVNDVDVSGTSFDMKDYLKDVEVKAIYSKIDYPITTDNSVSIDRTTANIGDKITITVKGKDGYTPRLIINGDEVKLSGNQYVYTVTFDKIDIKVVYEGNKPTPVSEISSVDNIAVSVFPNPAIKGEKFNINIEGSADLNGAEILIYDSMGRLAKRWQNVSNHNEIDLASGIYNGVFVNKGVRKTFRIVVK